MSPLLANVYLDALDKELEKRGHSHCRYADDCNIYVGSQAAAERTLESARNWIEDRLRLKLNAAKSEAGRTWERFWDLGQTRRRMVILSEGQATCAAAPVLARREDAW